MTYLIYSYPLVLHPQPQAAPTRDTKNKGKWFISFSSGEEDVYIDICSRNQGLKPPPLSYR